MKNLPIKNIANFTKIPNTPENLAHLRRSAAFSYLVFYRESETGTERCAGATWDGKKFKYCDGRFAFPCMTPIFEYDRRVPRSNIITAWSRPIDWSQQ